jgi:hypothetical protein
MVPLSLQAVLESLANSAVIPSWPPEAELSAPNRTLRSLPVQALTAAVGVGVGAAGEDGVAVADGDVAGALPVGEPDVAELSPQALSAVPAAAR